MVVKQRVANGGKCKLMVELYFVWISETLVIMGMHTNRHQRLIRLQMVEPVNKWHLLRIGLTKR